MAQITYTNKETLNSQPSIADKNKVKAEDMNEIKEVVNTNYEEVGDISNLNTTDKSSIVNAVNELKGGEEYSTSEVNTGKTWIDGKPIYRQVYKYTSTSNSDNINVESWNIDSICFMQGFIYDSTNRQLDINYYVGANDFFRVLARLYNNNFTITVQRGNSNSRIIAIIIEYTKTTD